MPFTEGAGQILQNCIIVLDILAGAYTFVICGQAPKGGSEALHKKHFICKNYLWHLSFTCLFCFFIIKF